jgi:hypothetical protein
MTMTITEKSLKAYHDRLQELCKDQVYGKFTINVENGKITNYVEKISYKIENLVKL